MKSNCKFCGQDFLNTVTGTKKFCSVSCRDRFRWWDRKREKCVKKFVPNKCKCVYCGAEFINTNKRKPSGRRYCDQTCARRDWRKNNPEKERAQQRRTIENRKNDPIRNKIFTEKVRIMNQSPIGKFRHYRRGAESRNIEFLLTFDEFNNFWGKNCYYCTDKIKTVGIDRIDNNKGYTIENCVPCCGICNRMKMQYTMDNFIKKCIEISNNFKNKYTI
jgi:hypothetical protein